MRFQLAVQRITSSYPTLPVIASRRRFTSRASALEHIIRSSPSHGNGGPPEEHPEDGIVTDHEWELRAGRAVDTLRKTLPRFFLCGLVDRLDSDMSPSGSHEHAAPESIYSHNIQLEYTPPSRLPPFPQTLYVQGLPLYHASATFVRRSLSMIYTDLQVELRRAQIHSHGQRDRKFTIGIGVLGHSRMGGTNGEWDVVCTYHISPSSGLINRHVVESIRPAPTVSVYQTLSNALMRLAGLKPSADQPAISSDLRVAPNTVPVHSESKARNGSK